MHRDRQRRRTLLRCLVESARCLLRPVSLLRFAPVHGAEGTVGECSTTAGLGFPFHASRQPLSILLLLFAPVHRAGLTVGECSTTAGLEYPAATRVRYV